MTLLSRLWSANWMTRFSVIYLFILAILGILIPFFPQFDPTFFDPNTLGDPMAPSWTHWFGTDDLNRDILIRSIYGARISLTVGVVAVGISTMMGVLYGLISGSVGGRTDSVMMQVLELFMAIPSIF